MNTSRGRVTIVEVVQILFVIAGVYALWPVVDKSLRDNVGLMSAGEIYLIRLLLPLMLLVLLATLYLTAGSGAQR